MQALSFTSASGSAFSSRAARRNCVRNAERLRSQLLGLPKRSVRGHAKCNAQQIVSAQPTPYVVTYLPGAQPLHAPTKALHNLFLVLYGLVCGLPASSQGASTACETTHVPSFHVNSLPVSLLQSHNLATELVHKLPAAALAGLITTLGANVDVARAADFFAPPPESNTAVAEQQQSQSLQFQAPAASAAPALTNNESQLPEGNQWRYSEFINAVQSGKVERVRFSKDGSMVQLTAVDGRRATVVLPNDPELVDILAKNGVDISVSEGDQQGNYVALLGNILFPLIAFGGLFFLFRRAQGGQGGMGGPMGPMGGPMEFGRSKSKFQEVPETGVTFQDVAVSILCCLYMQCCNCHRATALLCCHA